MEILNQFSKRMGLSPLFFFLIFIGVFIGIFDTFERNVNFLKPTSQSIFFDVLGAGSFHYNRILMLFSLFAIAVLVALTLQEDVKKGLFDRFLSKYGYIKTFLGISSVVFFIAFILTVIPCIVSECVALYQRPLLWPNYYNSIFMVYKPTYFLVSWQLYHPIAYTALRILFLGLWGGLFSLFVVGVYFLSNNAYTTILITPLSIIILDIFSDVILRKSYILEGIYKFKFPLQGLLIGGFIFIGCWLLGFWRKRKDVF